MGRPKTVHGCTKTTLYIFKKPVVEKFMARLGYRNFKDFYTDLVSDAILRMGDEEIVAEYFKEKTEEELNELKNEAKKK